MKKLAVTFLLILIFQLSFSHPWKAPHCVIIDTDAGIDDMRAISMLISSDDVEILGIIVSGGALSPYDGYLKIKSMLNSYHHNGIPVAMNYNIRGHDLEVPLSLTWGEEKGLMVPETNGFNKLCKNICKYETGEISFISLASLNSIAELIKGGVLEEEKIKEIIWSNNSLNKLGGFNASIDMRSANLIVKGDIPLITVGYPSGNTFYDNNFLSDLSGVENRYTGKILDVFDSNPGLKDHDFSSAAADEMVAVYLHYPDLFNGSSVKKHMFMKPASLTKIKEAAIHILRGEQTTTQQVLKEIPSDTSYYQADLQPFISDIISRYGKAEWESGVITNEMHRHLGIFSIVGVKMGILAREYFNVGVDEMELVSYAGSAPPLSCLNDGLQVSTGATVGHGLIKISSSELQAAAEFTHNGVKIRVSLNEDIASSVISELHELSLVNGLDSDIYWELVRQRAILHWKNLDRYEIFEIEEIPSAN